MRKKVVTTIKDNKRLFISLSIALSVLLNGFQFAYAGDQEDKIIAKIVKAYGGENLTKLKTFSVHDKYKLLYIDQGLTPDFTETNKNNVTFSIDFENRRKSLTSWESSGRGNRLTKVIYDGEKGRNYDLFNKTYDNSNYYNFDTVGASIVRAHDTLLAHLAWSSKETAEYQGKSTIRTIPHEKIKLKMPQGPELTLHVNSKSGLISKMTRNHRLVGEIAYLFSNYKTTDGVTFARDLQLNFSGHPELISVSKTIEVNPSLKDAFTEKAGFRKRGETIDSSEMSVRKLGEGIYFAGQNHRFSLFIDVGDYFVATGGNGGLKARFDAVKQESGLNKPLKYQIVTHHHSDHLESMADAERLGAYFITVKEHIDSIQKSLPENISENRFELVSNKAVYADGAIEVHEFSSTHSQQNLLVYVPAAKLLFTADHFSTDLKTELPNADKGTVILRKFLNSLQLNVEKLLGAHGARILTISELHKVADNYSEGQCPSSVTICE